ncbi:hypothetical protein [Eubacterium sp.]|uniref:hypothetical protein n=1 Tax=Eubacterium sp. TaxID=142586 RepID=UPI003522F3D7
MNYRITYKDKTELINTPEKVYDYVMNNVYDNPTEDALIGANDVKCWCELANAGDTYSDKELTVECVYNF